MFNTCCNVYMVLIVWSSVLTYSISFGQSCDSSWFGSSKCIYKCRCTSPCNSTTGACLAGGTCQGGWFGPACQYADLAYNLIPIVGDNTMVLTDGNDSTCLPPGSGDSVTLNLTDNYPFTWLRLYVNDSGKDILESFEIIFGETQNQPCQSLQTSKVDENTLDAHCNVLEPVQFVTIKGAVVTYLCSIYISKGRNVALKQNTQQSSNYSENSPNTNYTNIVFDATRAVDGNTSQKFYDMSCTHTMYNTNTSWRLDLGRTFYVAIFVLYNRNDESKIRLQNFTLESYNATNSLVYNYTDPVSPPQLIYIVKPNGLIPVKLTNIILPMGMLTLCEVEIYGDSICYSGFYGRECENTCNCYSNETCFISTGGCPSGCATGYKGEDCNTVCGIGTFGRGCKQNCSPHCGKTTETSKSVCDHVNGTCLFGCDAGYQDSTCSSSCDAEKFGPGCYSTCSKHCASAEAGSGLRTCDHINGTCLYLCKPGYLGDMCEQECNNGTYGVGCLQSCSSHCHIAHNSTDRVCDFELGHCVNGCKDGYQPPLCVSEAMSQTTSKPTGIDVLIPAIVIPVVAVIIIVVILLLFLFRRRAAKKHDAEFIASTKNDNLNTSHNGSFPNSVLNTPVMNRPKNGSTDKVYYNEFAKPNLTGVSVLDLPALLKTKDKYFFQKQFSAIPINKDAKSEIGLSPENKHKNRYKNVAAYDHSRVQLIPNKEKKEGDYINASYIKGYNNDEKFIASQGPTTMILNDFVRMLWEQKVEKVVMLTNLVENAKHKCERYWPEEGELKVGEITVKLTTTQVFADYTIRRLQLIKPDHPAQNILHFHFTSWPDKDVPSAPWGLVDFEQRVASYTSDKPVVVHCSAGVGRTGTFIALRNVMREAEETGNMDFFRTVKELRQDRINMVQTLDQYIFLHQAAQVALLCIGTSVTLSDAKDRIQSLETKTKTGQTKMELEYLSICAACDNQEEVTSSGENPYNVYENSQILTNRSKNRISNVLPKEAHRPKLTEEGSESTGYINAVLVPSFHKPNHQILTQLPLPTTVTDFWRLVTQYQVSLVVALHKDSNTPDETIGVYLPKGENEPATFSEFTVTTKPITEMTLCSQQELDISFSIGKSQKKHHVTHLTCQDTDLNPGQILSISEQARTLRRKGNGRTLFMCRNGAEYSGLVCVLSLLLDRMDNDHHLTVPLVVGAVKEIRPQVIPTLEQYRLLYKVLTVYSESMNEYSNFNGSLK